MQHSDSKPISIIRIKQQSLSIFFVKMVLSMMATLAILCGPLSSLAEVSSVPHEIIEQMSLRVQQGECQKEWVNNLELAQIFVTNSDDQKIIAMPCSLWTHNQAWSLFLVIYNRRRLSEVALVKPLYFIRYSSYKGLYASNTVENIRWSPLDQKLSSRKFLNGNINCGEISSYQWSVSNQDFKTMAILKNDDCSPVGQWTPLHLGVSSPQ